MKTLCTGLLTYLILLWKIVGALHIDVEGRRRGINHPLIQARGLGKPLTNTRDLGYYANIVLGNRSFEVLVDTGSSDLWVAGLISDSNDTGSTASVTYAVGSVKGPVKTASLQFAGHVVPSQAYLEVPPNQKNQEGTGVIGLGPNAGSFIYQETQTIERVAVLDRIFLQNRTTPNYFTILLGRDKDPTDRFEGSITIGEVLDGYTSILGEPRILMTDVAGDVSQDQHLQVLLDTDGIIGPDGNAIPIKSQVLSSPDQNRATIVLDCGFTLPQLPRAVSDAIYSKFEGAEYAAVSKVGPAWIIPCDQEVNISFVFGGKRFPVHPLDMTMDPSVIGLDNVTNSQGVKYCIGTFQPFSYDRGENPNYDMVLGMSFMRNVYTLFDYGDFIVNSTEKDPPYIQLLSITDPAQAHEDFVQVRLTGEDTTGNKRLKGNSSKVDNVTKYVVAISVSVVVALLFVAAFIVHRSRKQ